MGRLHSLKTSPKTKLDCLNLLLVDGQMLTAEKQDKVFAFLSFAQLN
jgi:hypothetical protein